MNSGSSARRVCGAAAKLSLAHFEILCHAQHMLQCLAISPVDVYNKRLVVTGRGACPRAQQRR